VVNARAQIVIMIARRLIILSVGISDASPGDEKCLDHPTDGLWPAATTPTPESTTPGPRIAATDTILNVPFPAKDQAKSLGAQWHADKKRWVVPAGLDLAPFTAWLD